jgi:hypothetical protein
VALVRPSATEPPRQVAISIGVIERKRRKALARAGRNTLNQRERVVHVEIYALVILPIIA